MTTPNYEEARDEILGLFHAAWQANSPVLNGGSAPYVHWYGAMPYTPPTNEPWARVSLQHTGSFQTTLAPSGGRRFTRLGLAQVQVFTPLTTGGLSVGMPLAIVARDAFEGVGTDTGIWFRNCRILEIGPDQLRSSGDGTWYQWLVSAEFQYDERR